MISFATRETLLLDQVECVMVREWHWDYLAPADVANRLDVCSETWKRMLAGYSLSGMSNARVCKLGLILLSVRIWGQEPYLFRNPPRRKSWP